VAKGKGKVLPGKCCDHTLTHLSKL